VLPLKQKLPQESLDHLQSTLQTYQELAANGSPNPGCDAVIADVSERLRQKPQDIWWTDLALAESCVAERLGIEEIRARLRGWRRRFAEVAGDKRYADYIGNAPDAVNEMDRDKLKADLINCVRSVYYFYSAYGVAAQSRTKVTRWLLTSAAILIVLEAIVIWALQSRFIWVNWLLLASTTAIAGSVISVQRRLQDPTVDVDPFYRYIQEKADWFGIAVVSPLFAAIFGMVMFGFLVSGIISEKFLSFKPDLEPSAAKDAAILLILGLVSGFAEQLIPDALNRIAAKALSSVGLVAAPSPQGGQQQLQDQRQKQQQPQQQDQDQDHLASDAPMEDQENNV
jgi:hypothetical protein